MKADIRINILNNGATVRSDSGEEVFKFDSDNRADLVIMLYTILDIIEPNQKYDKECIEIKLIHGRGYDCKDKNCSVCRKNK